MQDNGYMNYQAMLTQINTSASSLAGVCGDLDLTEQGKTLKDIMERMQSHNFKVGIMGEFKRGKSTVINALLGKEIVPADILPCTATLNRIVWDSKPHAQVNFKPDENGNRKPSREVAVEELSDYVTKLAEESERQASEVEDAVVYYPCKFCQDGVQIVDTPGLNDDERMDYISESVIPTLDAIIMVLVPGAPFSISEANFVRNKIMTSDLSRLIFLVNKIDTVRKKDRERVIEGIRGKIQKTVLEKTASVYGEDSKEYQDTKAKLGGIRIYAISAQDALDGKLEGDEELLEGSQMGEFEDALTRLLTEERGMLELVGPVNTVLGKMNEAKTAIEMRKNAMNMEAEEFKKIQEEAIEKLETSRNEKKQKVREIKAVAASAYQELMPMVVDGYNRLEDRLMAYMDQCSITPQNFADEASAKAFQDELNSRIGQEFQASLQESMEKIQVQIGNRLSQEVENLSTYHEKISANINAIRCSIPASGLVASKGVSGTDKIAMAAEAVTNFAGIAGISGLITGYRDHGVAGAAVGFGTSMFATNFAIGFMATFLASCGIAITAVTAVPILVISGIAGAFGGKKITNALFNLFGKPSKSNSGAKKGKITESDIASIRIQMKESIKENVKKLRSEQTLEKWLKSTTNEIFTNLSMKLDQETEEVLQGMQDTLTNIQIDLTKGEAQRKSIEEKLDKASQRLDEIAGAILPIKQKLDAALGA